MTWNERLREERKKRQLTQANIGKKLNLSQIAISQYERGVRQPEFDTLKQLCLLYHVSSDYILGLPDT